MCRDNNVSTTVDCSRYIMVLTLIGLGLSDEKDITMKGLEEVRKADIVYLEAYTGILGASRKQLETYFNKEVIEADRRLVEQGADEIISSARSSNVAFLVVGDPFCATTHGDICLQARKQGVQVKVVHNASIVSAVGCCGLQIYRFGQTVSIPFFHENWRPDSFYEKIKNNRDAGCHTLCLLDIRVKEQSIENMMRGNRVYEPSRLMTVQDAIEQLWEVESRKRENVCSMSARAFGVARIGADTQTIYSGTLAELACVQFGPPPHSLIICARTLHEMELEFYELLHCQRTQTST